MFQTHGINDFAPSKVPLAVMGDAAKTQHKYKQRDPNQNKGSDLARAKRRLRFLHYL